MLCRNKKFKSITKEKLQVYKWVKEILIELLNRFKVYDIAGTSSTAISYMNANNVGLWSSMGARWTLKFISQVNKKV